MTRTCMIKATVRVYNANMQGQGNVFPGARARVIECLLKNGSRNRFKARSNIGTAR